MDLRKFEFVKSKKNEGVRFFHRQTGKNVEGRKKSQIKKRECESRVLGRKKILM